MSDLDLSNVRFKCTERYAQGWTDPRGLEPSVHTPFWYEGKDMTVAYCHHYQRDTPHADGICIYHKAGECRGEQ